MNLHLVFEVSLTRYSPLVLLAAASSGMPFCNREQFCDCRWGAKSDSFLPDSNGEHWLFWGDLP